MIGTGPIPPKAPRQACDNCRRRKTKCSRSQPCEKCIEAFLSCTYNSLPRRKGPKGRTAPVLSSLPTLSSRYKELPSHPEHHAQVGASVTGTPLPGWPASRDAAISPPFSSLPSHLEAPADSYGPVGTGSVSSFHSSPGDQTIFPTAPRSIQPQCLRIPPQVLLDHVNVFLQNLFPIMPVFDPKRAQDDCINPEALSPQRYAFLASLAATARVQLKMDVADQQGGMLESAGGSPYQSNTLSAEYFLTEALQARAQFDIVEQRDMDNLLTSFFLFAAYGNLNKQNQAWFYLSQCISLAIAQNLHLEDSYSGLDPDEVEERRRIFWLLFVTERAYALQQKKPVTLQNSIRKPEVFHSKNPALTYGFLALIDLFDKLTPDFYRILCAKNYNVPDKKASIASTHRNLCESVPLLNEVLETQRVDILITQGWLQVWLWKLAMTDLLQNPSPGSEPVIPPDSPAVVGKSFMSVFVSVSQSSMDAHGIGMEQKLFDVGTSVADLVTMLPSRATQRVATMVVDPKELLWGILLSLSKIRGAESYLFPLLMEQSRGVLGILDSPFHGNMPSTPAAPVGQDVGLGGNNQFPFVFVDHGAVVTDEVDGESNQLIDDQGGDGIQESV